MTDLNLAEDQNRVREFARALRLALFDVAQEAAARDRGNDAAYGVRYFYDADVSTRMILGFQHQRTTHRPPTDEQDLVRALLSCGYLGTMTLLPPHAWEVDDSVRRQADLRQQRDLDIFRTEAEDFIRDKEIADQLDMLSKDLDNAADHKDIISKFAGIAPKTLIALDAVNGTYVQRLARYTKMHLLRFESRGWEIPELIDSDAGYQFRIAITKARRQSLSTREQSLLNTMRDAAALTILHQMIKSPAQFGHVRFYSESETLWKLLDGSSDAYDDTALELLSYPAQSESPSLFDAALRCVFRSPTYFLVRARFAAVRFPGVEVREGEHDMSLAELTNSANDLEKVLSDTKLYERLILRIRLEGKPLSTILRELESLSFVRSIWLKFQVPAILDEYLEQWTNVWNFVKGKGTVQLIDAQIGEIGTEFQDRLSALKVWSEDLREIRKAALELRKDCGTSPLPEPLRDLGLVRWGAALDTKHRTQLEELMGELLDPSEVTAAGTTQRLASRLHRDQLSGQSAIVLCAILFLLKLDKLVVTSAKKFAPLAEQTEAVTLHLISAAASLRGSLTISPERLDERLQEAKRIVQERPEEERPRYLLGLAYLHFWAWKLVEHDEESRAWATESFRYGEEGVRSFQRHSLEWTFAVNNCVYVGYMARMIAEAKPYRDRLIQLRASPHWHYRFADTLAVTHLEVARDRLRAFEPGPSSVDVLALIERELQSATKYLALASPTYGDEEVDAHKYDSENLGIELATLRLDNAAPSSSASTSSRSTLIPERT